MVDGNELPTTEAALFARMIVLHFEDNKFSDETTNAYKIADPYSGIRED